MHSCPKREVIVLIRLSQMGSPEIQSVGYFPKCYKEKKIPKHNYFIV